MTAPMRAKRANAAHLSPDSLAQLRALLLRERDSQTEQGAEHRETTDELTGHTDVDSRLEREIAQGCAALTDAAILDIQDALDRLDRGTYGLCESCGEPIPFERLEAIPHARLCVACPGRHTGLVG